MNILRVKTKSCIYFLHVVWHYQISGTVGWACETGTGRLVSILGGVIPKAWKTVRAACPDSCSALWEGLSMMFRRRAAIGLPPLQHSLHTYNPVAPVQVSRKVRLWPLMTLQKVYKASIMKQFFILTCIKRRLLSIIKIGSSRDRRKISKKLALRMFFFLSQSGWHLFCRTLYKNQIY